MSKPNDFRPDGSKRLGLRLAAITGVALVATAGVLLLQMPRGAAAGVATGADDRVTAKAPAAASNPKAPATYQLRCWQYGRLLFDEGPVTLSPEARQAAKLVAFDRNGAALVVTDNGWTTCLARPAAVPRSLALPR